MVMQTKPFVQDGEDYREMTDAEYTQYQVDQVANTAQAAQAAKAAADKATARQAVLDRLGITIDEAKLLLG